MRATQKPPAQVASGTHSLETHSLELVVQTAPIGLGVEHTPWLQVLFFLPSQWRSTGSRP
jgi:hypothetical protein